MAKKRKPPAEKSVGEPDVVEEVIDEGDLEAVRKSIVGKICMDRHPAVFGLTLPLKGPRKRAVGLDLATSTGVSYSDFGSDPTEKHTMWIGQWDLSSGPIETGPIRLLRLRHFLSVLKPDLIFLEDVKNTPPTAGMFSIQAVLARVSASAEFLGALKWCVMTWAEENGVPAMGVPIQTIKKYATGVGNANKVAMINACNQQFQTSLDPETYTKTGADNMADSAFLCKMAVEAYFEGMQGAGKVQAQEDAHAEVHGGSPGIRLARLPSVDGDGA